jgi:hypothetical protein
MYVAMEFMFGPWNNISAFLLLKETAISEICLVTSVGSNDIYYKLCYCAYEWQNTKKHQSVNRIIFVFFGIISCFVGSGVTLT